MEDILFSCHTNLNIIGCLKKSVKFKKKYLNFFQEFFELLKGQFGNFLCLSHREFPEVFQTPPTLNSSPFQSGVIAKIPLKSVFLGHPV